MTKPQGGLTMARIALLAAAAAILTAAVVAGHAVRAGRKWSPEE